MRILTTLGLLLALAFVLPTGVLAADVTVEMWNKDPEDKKRKMVFSQEIVVVEPGESVTWLATDKGHNVEFIAGPEGWEAPKKSKVSKDVTLTFDTPGVYLYQCTPHKSMGMIAVVVVGDGDNDISGAKVKGKSKKKLKEILEQL